MAFVTCIPSFDAENGESDYGSDLDTDGQQILEGIVSLLETAAVKPLVLERIEEDAPSSSPGTAIVSKIVQRAALASSVEIEYDEPSRTAFRSKFGDSTTGSTFATDELTATSRSG